MGFVITGIAEICLLYEYRADFLKKERVLVIYGVGHLHLLTQFLQESGLFSLNPVEKYLA
ncbi:DUF5694 domain-containing protein [Ornithinibacillus gellani]|uniref:DUF5694 domain-containing protein n=1 Tax=Ornithinibacillus gellani TaxID=2293253 RepID=UPI0037C5C73C